jgi:hypothetical protein
MYDFVMTAAAAHVPGPAIPARLLPVHVSLCKPALLLRTINTIAYVSHRAERVFYEAMATVQSAIGRDA